jgi:hypothetical protein
MQSVRAAWSRVAQDASGSPVAITDGGVLVVVTPTLDAAHEISALEPALLRELTPLGVTRLRLHVARAAS